MTAASARVLYIHGFNSSPASEKAQSLLRFCNERFPAVPVSVPRLSYDPDLAAGQLEDIIGAAGAEPVFLVGSSLGGYYATWLAEKYGLKAALINPAVSPYSSLYETFLGWHTNMHTGEQYRITPAHADCLRSLDTAISRPENFLLLVQTGDEVLDYRMATEKYAGARQLVQEGGSHAFEDFEAVLPEIFRFAELAH